MSGTYYVNARSPVALDDNSGTVSRPWKTINRAALIAKAGDTVLVFNGIYREMIEVKNSGVSYDSMVTFLAAGDSVFVKGSDAVAGWNHWVDRIWFKENWEYNSQQVFVDGKPLDQIGGNPWYSPDRLPAFGQGVDDMKPGTFFYDRESRRLYIWLHDSGDPNEHLVEASVRHVLFYLEGKAYVRLSGFKFQHSNTTAVIKTGWPAVVVSGDYCIVENNEVTWCDFAGIGGTGNHLLVINNTCNYNGNSGMGFRGRFIRLVNNTTSYNNYRGFDMNWHAGGIKVTKFERGTIEQHTAIGNRGHAIWVDIDSDSVTISRSLVRDNEGMGIFFEISRSGLIMNNLVYENGINGIYVSASEGCSVLNNLAYRNKRGIVVHGLPRAGYRLQNNLVANNIMVDNRDADLVIAQDTSAKAPNLSDYNLYFRSSGLARFRKDYDQLIQGLPLWSSTTGMDRSSVYANPQFLDAERRDFRPLATSPTIGRGKSLGLVRDDYTGKPRKEKTDIGPFEF